MLVIAIAANAKPPNQLRENRLNPPEWMGWVRTPEVVYRLGGLNPTYKIIS